MPWVPEVILRRAAILYFFDLRRYWPNTKEVRPRKPLEPRVEILKPLQFLEDVSDNLKE